MLGIPTEEEIVVTAWVLKIGETSELLNAVVTANRPELVILACRTKSFSIILLFQLYFLFTYDALDGIHGQ